jgi:hypothetical protein
MGRTTQKGGKVIKGKLRMDLVRPEVVVALASVLQLGAEKYDEDSYLEEPIEQHRAALLRHFYRMNLESVDQDSKLPHSWHVLACAAILVSIEQPATPWLLAEINGTEPKDRPWCDPRADLINKLTGSER